MKVSANGPLVPRVEGRYPTLPRNASRATCAECWWSIEPFGGHRDARRVWIGGRPYWEMTNKYVHKLQCDIDPRDDGPRGGWGDDSYWESDFDRGAEI